MTFKFAVITAVLTVLAVAAGVLIASQGWSLVTTALVGSGVGSGLTALGIAVGILSEHPEGTSGERTARA